jgi:hypothetical protein
MTHVEGTVLAASVAAIGWINWYFFVAGRQMTPAASSPWWKSLSHARAASASELRR